ncbi:isoaspartyl peptidase/L-asparaginase family protein [Sphingomicrobium aestuariivivum]|uniref:isoaspartyl peptidase/L-asparaginase family protein n=1 Tax=Sphingomicrobium aestuariivivum TaxID=1582356 RepID=UPI001FD6DAC7|nr:isoaspartyl peptidase/L-asparaginase [Sphingomicrobium aestuariivivum]MCJ8191241.1 isoaspartyl peptidase/L-asparaginase [Sphingomicrobium aestuariivivum]
MWKLMIHGGAGSMRPGHLDAEQERAARAGLADALEAGAAILADGGSAVDAVEAAARVLEEDPAFNAGRGSVLAADGHVECDAAIMDGNGRHAGAVAGLRSTRAPISAARKVMEDSPHVLISKGGADEFAREAGLEQVANSWFVTSERRRQLDELLAKGHDAFDAEIKYGTIGAVAVDANGHVAAATSTGGLTAKRWGRIGDSPLIGAGTYADDRAAAVSATGLGEIFIRTAAAHEICARMRFCGHDLQKALDEVLEEIGDMGGTGGIIAVSPEGDAAWSFTTPGMYRGLASHDGSREVAVFGEE